MKKQIITIVSGILFGYAALGQTRVVLIEQFTNAGCPPCASSTPPVLNYVNNNPADVVAIAYHTSFPYNDSMYHENPVQSAARVSYYGIAGVPYSIVDGNYYENSSSTFASSIATIINNRKQMAAGYEVQSIAFDLSGNTLTGSFQLQSLRDSNSMENLVARVVVIEKTVLKNSYAASPGANSETQYGYVMRRMLPDQNGTTLINKQLNGLDTVSFSWNLDKIKNNSEVRVVVFVQNTMTKEVYQAKIFQPQVSTVSIKELVTDAAVRLYPNPATSNVSIALGQEQLVKSVEIRNMLGQLVQSVSIGASKNTIDLALQLEPGIYYLNLLGDLAVAPKKLIIAK